MGEVLEEFQAYVDKFDEDEGVGYFTIWSKLNGDKFYGHLPIAELQLRGIGEEDSFWIKTFEDDHGHVSLEYGLIPPRELSDEEIREIREKIDAVFGDIPPGVVF
jgi:hypothetical protein